MAENAPEPVAIPEDTPLPAPAPPAGLEGQLAEMIAKLNARVQTQVENSKPAQEVGPPAPKGAPAHLAIAQLDAQLAYSVRELACVLTARAIEALNRHPTPADVTLISDLLSMAKDAYDFASRLNFFDVKLAA